VDLRLLPAEHFAVLLIDTTAGLYAIRIDPGGKLSPVAIRWS